MSSQTTRKHHRQPPAASVASEPLHSLSALDALLAQAQAFEHPSRSSRGKENERSWDGLCSDNWSVVEEDETRKTGGAARASNRAEEPARGAARAKQQNNEPMRLQDAALKDNRFSPALTSAHASRYSSDFTSTLPGSPDTADDSDASPIVPTFPHHRSPSAVSQQPSLSALSGGGTGPGLERWNSTRRYMAQLDPDDEETESLAGDEGNRDTWASDQRDSLASQTRFGAPGRQGVPMENMMSAMTVESTDGDPFHYSLCEEPEFAAGLPPPHPPVPIPPPFEPHQPSLAAATFPIVRLGPPSPSTEAFLASPHKSPAVWNDSLASPPATSSTFIADAAGSTSLPPTVVASPPAVSIPTAGRTPSQTIAKNFSRPFIAPRDPPLRTIRSDSVDSLEGNTLQSSLGHGSSLGHSSSIGHSSAGHSSQGAHSMSSSWDERQQYGMRQHEAARERMAPAESSSRGGAMEELKAEGASGGARGQRPDSPAEPSSTRSDTAPKPPVRSASLGDRSDRYTPPSASLSRSIDSPSNVLSLSHPSPVPRPPISPALVSPLSKPRLPPPTPLGTSYSELSREASQEELRLQASSGPDISPRQRNVLRKARPEQRKDPVDRSTPSSALPNSSSTETPSRPWNRFRSKSKSSGSTTIPFAGGASDSRFSHLTTGSTYSQDSYTPTITFQPPSRPIGDLSELAQRARELGAQRRKWDELKLKPSVAKSAQASFVHAGEADVERAWLETRPAVDGAMERLSPNLSAPSMRRAVSDQGARRFEPPSNASSRPPSLYSDYSYYSMPGSGLSSRQVSPLPSAGEGHLASQQSAGRSAPANDDKTMDTFRKATAGLKTVPQWSTKGREYVEPGSGEANLKMGIDLHEKGDLARAAWSFEQSAKQGCSAGMLMWGVTLQHGWGCRVNAPLGFRFLQSAAESIIEDLDRNFAGGHSPSPDARTIKAAQKELALALHEMAQSFRFGGSGVERDKPMAVAYLRAAADLGDVDAQSDLAFCYANGKGCKKDLKSAAKYYRLAMAQGAPSFGLSWVYKEKYMDN